MDLIDNHSHSHFSFDSAMEVGQAVEAARKAGLKGICITDHFDFDPPAGIKVYDLDIDAQQDEIEKVRDGIKDGFILLEGIEIGVQEQSMEKIRSVLRENSFDCVIASQHFIDGHDPYYGEYYRGYGCREAYGRYLEAFYNGITEMEDFDILGHYDYIVRYSPYGDTVLRYSEYSDIMDSILRYLAENGKTLEINTKTYQLYRGKEPRMDVQVLRRFRELGGEAVSLGSDAHGPERIGDRFSLYADIARAAGIRYEAYFKGRRPCMLPL